MRYKTIFFHLSISNGLISFDPVQVTVDKTIKVKIMKYPPRNFSHPDKKSAARRVVQLLKGLEKLDLDDIPEITDIERPPTIPARKKSKTASDKPRTDERRRRPKKNARTSSTVIQQQKTKRDKEVEKVAKQSELKAISSKIDAANKLIANMDVEIGKLKSNLTKNVKATVENKLRGKRFVNDASLKRLRVDMEKQIEEAVKRFKSQLTAVTMNMKLIAKRVDAKLPMIDDLHNKLLLVQNRKIEGESVSARVPLTPRTPSSVNSSSSFGPPENDMGPLFRQLRDAGVHSLAL